MLNTLKNKFKNYKSIYHRALIIQPPTPILRRSQTYPKTSLQMCIQQPDLYELEMNKTQETPMFQPFTNELEATVELEMIINQLIEGDNSYLILQMKSQSKYLKQMIYRCQQLDECTDLLMNNVNQLTERINGTTI
ncbi:Hypothetical_protein [Hexamita inflata]|uniref:Hypothetical_protein n=1 Tax=Hexamita inflata TaxID=28002 RepID=A0AA86QEZ0_9EUKA|nr:Hypothetical protein HINF_LOCUS1316 [Hexamita inflata]CAI9951902.1 Hypothetical protein HINF_LOCUS39547 [Hexamita inflata]CAI9951905.1 Hypothetical protein HINF_LOCUS39550 [Hexamita inflata]